MKREHLKQHGAELPGAMSSVPKRLGASVSTWQGVSVYSRVDPSDAKVQATVCVHMSDCGIATSVRLSPSSAVKLARNLLAAVDQLERLAAAETTAPMQSDRSAVLA